jgi:hypothetical protein
MIGIAEPVPVDGSEKDFLGMLFRFFMNTFSRKPFQVIHFFNRAKSEIFTRTARSITMTIQETMRMVKKITK